MNTGSQVKKLIMVVAVFLIIGVFVVLNMVKERGEVYEVQTSRVKKGDITQIVSGYGKIQAVKEVDVSAYVAAEITRLHVREGEEVKKGQLLVEQDKTRYEAIMERSQSDLISARANLNNAKVQLKRMKTLYAEKFIAKTELEQAQLDFELAESRLIQCKAVIKQAKDDLVKTRLVSPIDGIVISLDKEEGEMALSSQLQVDSIMTVADLSRMEMRVEVDETEVALVTIGDKAKIYVDAFQDREFHGTVSEIAHKATTRGLGTQEEVTIFEVKIRVNDNEVQHLRSGMSATVDIETETRKETLYIPIQAITTREVDTGSEGNINGQVVFVVEQKKVKMVPVESGIMNETDVEITNGLTEKQEIVTGSFRTLSKLLKDGARVKIIKTPRTNKSGKKD